MTPRTYVSIAVSGGPAAAGTVRTTAGQNSTPPGYATCGLGGPTTGRPLPYDADIPNYQPHAGEHYLDTTLGAVVVWDGFTWRNPFTGAIA